MFGLCRIRSIFFALPRRQRQFNFQDNNRMSPIYRSISFISKAFELPPSHADYIPYHRHHRVIRGGRSDRLPAAMAGTGVTIATTYRGSWAPRVASLVYPEKGWRLGSGETGKKRHCFGAGQSRHRAIASQLAEPAL